MRGSSFSLWSKEEPIQGTSHVRIQECHVALKGKRGDSPRGVRANTRKISQLLDRIRKHAPESLDDGLGRPLQIDGAAVVAKPGPDADHVRGWGYSKVLDSGKPLQEPLVVGDDAIDLSLLEHHLRDEDGVGISRIPPRQVTPVGSEPRQKGLADALEAIRIERRGWVHGFIQGDGCA